MNPTTLEQRVAKIDALLGHVAEFTGEPEPAVTVEGFDGKQRQGTWTLLL